MKSEYEVIDNFMDKDDFKNLQSLVMGNDVPWYFTKNINTSPGYDPNSNQSYLTHHIFNPRLDYVYSTLYKDFYVFLKLLGMKSIIRAKLNLYMRTDKIEEHNSHTDSSFEHKGCVFSFNTCDGYTKLEDGTKIDSVANRALIFDASKSHSSTSTTNAKGRFNVNFNYF